MTEAFIPDPVSCSVVAQAAYHASLPLAIASITDRNAALSAMAQALHDSINEILEANTLDLEASREMATPEIVQDWLKLTPERLEAAIQSLNYLVQLPDPLRQGSPIRSVLTPCPTYSRRLPLGVIVFVYEAFPELGAIAAGMCLKTGNSLILRGTSEASQSNAVITQVLQAAIATTGLSANSLQSIPTEDAYLMRELITQDQWVNLVIPYGRPSLIQQVLKQATVPVLKTVIGNCYLYWSATGSVEAVRSAIVDSHQGQPDAVNAIEKVLVHSQQNLSSVSRLLTSLREQGFEVRGDQALVTEFPDLTLAKPEEWSQPYLSPIVSFKLVQDLAAATSWINDYSSGHADCVITESYSETRRFVSEVNSALIYTNSSPRFYRSLKPGEPVCLGMSNQKGDRRGVIGLDSLTTAQQVIQGLL